MTEPTAGATAGSATTLGREERDVEAGTYRLDLTELAGGGDEFVPFLATVPDGWHAIDGWILNRPRAGQDVAPVSVLFWNVDQIYAHPCQWSGSLVQPGPTVDDMAAALVAVPLRNATEPIDVGAVELTTAGTWLFYLLRHKEPGGTDLTVA